jgi:hypothetical protein
MIRLIAAVGFAVALATSAQAITPAPLTQPDAISRKFASDAALAGPELLVSVSLELPFAILVGLTAGALTEGCPSGALINDLKMRDVMKTVLMP